MVRMFEFDSPDSEQNIRILKINKLQRLFYEQITPKEVSNFSFSKIKQWDLENISVKWTLLWFSRKC